MAFTEFCCRSGGSNLNAGTRTGDSTEPGTSADLTYASGNWVAGTGVFTVASGDPASDGVAVGDFASVYADGSTVTGFVGRVTARDATTITVSLSAKAGTAPTNGTGDRTLKVGGAWQGPNAASAFPFTLGVLSSLTNASSDATRINLVGTFNITAAMGTVNPQSRIEGYATSYGDGGLFTIDGGSSGSSYKICSIFQGHLKNCIIQNNGATGSGDGIGGGFNTFCVMENVTVTGVLGNGFTASTGSREGLYINCRAHGVGGAGFNFTGVVVLVSCQSYDNSSSGLNVSVGSNVAIVNCSFYNNGLHGIGLNAGGMVVSIQNCDFYENGGSGIKCVQNGALLFVRSSNFVKNGAYGIDGNANAGNKFSIQNCGFGSGTQANTSGTVNHPRSEDITGTVNYPTDTTPWSDPANGDFSVTADDAKGGGYGEFPTGLFTGYPDIGAAQHQDSGGGGAFAVIGRNSPTIRGKF